MVLCKLVSNVIIRWDKDVSEPRFLASWNTVVEPMNKEEKAEKTVS